ncbi:MAG: DNA alkylation repair protein [Candidatus Omnitrophota bacterium]|nr:DNA alkylation repair protein [Candidatus Omnitrophota bacterium]
MWKNSKKAADGIILNLKSLADSKSKEAMSRYGIKTEHALGISIPNIRGIAKEIGKNHDVALCLWQTKIHEARILASMIDDYRSVTEEQMELWVKAFNSWDLCDQCCGNLFDKTRFAHLKTMEWSVRKEEFVKRAGFVLMATLSVHDKKSKDEVFVKYFPIIKRECGDERNFVKKSVNWALRQIGKRNLNLNKKAINTAKEIQKEDSKAARWIAQDALRELQSDPIQQRLERGYFRRKAK